jgi:hypothetical protein
MDVIPKDAKILNYMHNTYFTDTHSVVIDKTTESALTIYLTLMRNTPTWVTVLMSLRNGIVAKLGLKNLGALSDVEVNRKESEYQIGDKIGIFILHTKSHQEVIVEDRDKHLDVKLSFYLETKEDHSIVHATSAVHVKNTFGKLYMFFVEPIHKIIVPSSLKKYVLLKRAKLK